MGCAKICAGDCLDGSFDGHRLVAESFYSRLECLVAVHDSGLKNWKANPAGDLDGPLATQPFCGNKSEYESLRMMPLGALLEFSG